MGGQKSKNLKENCKFSSDVFREYIQLEHHINLMSRDESHFTVEENKNFLKQNQLNKNHSYSKNLITTEQLIKEQIERKQNQLQQSVLSKRIPLDLKLVLIHHSDLQNPIEIGKGNFGTVYRAVYKDTRAVAIKTFHYQNETNFNRKSEEYDNNKLCEFLHEAYIMSRLEHPNVLHILGVTFFGTNHQLSIITDFMINGSLLDYLRKHQETFLQSNSKDIQLKLNSFAKQIFQAMYYLEEQNIIHRDLAARNCLIHHDNVVKVADFGLTKLTECGLYKGNATTKVAVRWSAPEALLRSNYTSRSDVWSYGITLWEIYSLGRTPFGNLNNFQVKKILKNSSENLSEYLCKPSYDFISNEVYTHIILPCLTYNVIIRPRFKDLIDRVILIFNNTNVLLSFSLPK